MRIAIIGAGFTGLAAGHWLLKHKHEVVIFERSNYVGGLGAGMRDAIDNFPVEWEWDLEQFYHHWFTNDYHVLQLGKDLNPAERGSSLTPKFITRRPVTSVLYQDRIYPFDSPLSILTFPHLKLIDKIRTALTMAQLKYLYNLKRSRELEDITAHQYLQAKLGSRSYQQLWEPLLKGKFGDSYREVSMRWFWARIYKRTPKLVYSVGGFSAFAQDIALEIYKLGGQIHLSSEIEKIEISDSSHLTLHPPNQTFDRIIVTTPPPSLSRLVANLPEDYTQSLTSAKGIGALTLVLSLHHPLMDKTYWLNVNDPSWPFLAVVEHTNFMDKSHYNNEHIVYIGDYLDKDHPHMQMKKDALIRKFTPYLKKINPLFSEESIIHSFTFKTPYAQPIPGLNHQAKILPLTTPVPGVFLATMAQVYPWDRGTNYAIELGQKVAHLATTKS